MAHDDRERWNERYRAGLHTSGAPSPVLVGLQRWLPSEGRALDVAGGAGASAVWLAERGLQVTVVDVSEVALARAVEHAASHRVELELVAADLELEPLPPGPWALVVCCSYLQRDLVPRIADALALGGRLVWTHPTTTNLARHPRPSARHLLQPGEARAIVEGAGLVVRVAEEGWVGPGASARCLARVVAERR